MIVARDVFGGVALYEIAENAHRRGILDVSAVPAGMPDALAAQVRDIARRIAGALDLVGMLAVELFVMPEGGVLVNELAPRPHNSGHWSIEACVTSQFENQVRVAMGLSVGPTTLLSPAATANILGDLWRDGEPRWQRVLSIADAKLHLYGKAEARPGRKMGHITALAPTAEQARARVLATRDALVESRGDAPEGARR